MSTFGRGGIDCTVDLRNQDFGRLLVLGVQCNLFPANWSTCSRQACWETRPWWWRFETSWLNIHHPIFPFWLFTRRKTRDRWHLEGGGISVERSYEALRHWCRWGEGEAYAKATKDGTTCEAKHPDSKREPELDLLRSFTSRTQVVLLYSNLMSTVQFNYVISDHPTNQRTAKISKQKSMWDSCNLL